VVFEPNDSNTWLSLSRVIENYLTRKWQDGALAGVTPQQAFYVKCGLGTSMTQDDMLNSRIKVEVGLAILSPGEFQVFEFSHLLKKPRIDALRSA
jgi:phage tail sheath protein FI